MRRSDLWKICFACKEIIAIGDKYFHLLGHDRGDRGIALHGGSCLTLFALRMVKAATGEENSTGCRDSAWPPGVA